MSKNEFGVSVLSHKGHSPEYQGTDAEQCLVCNPAMSAALTKQH